MTMAADIHFDCRACGQHLEAPPALAGQTLPCPDCGQRLRVPRLTVPLPAERTRTLSSTARIELPSGSVPPQPPPRRVVIKRPKGA